MPSARKIPARAVGEYHISALCLNVTGNASKVTGRLQSLFCCAARAPFRLKSITVVGAKQVLTDLIQAKSVQYGKDAT
jgi:hypothetical protein